MRNAVFLCITLVFYTLLPAQDQASATSFVDNDAVLVWIERATTLQKQLNRSNAENEELKKTVHLILVEKKKAEINYATANTQLKQLEDACKQTHEESIRSKDSLNNLMQRYRKQLEAADVRRKELESALDNYKGIIENQQDLLEARAQEFAEAQQFIVSFSSIQINVRNLWIRLEDNPASIFNANKRDQIKVVAYYINSSFDAWRVEVPVQFRLMRETGAGRNVKAEPVIDIKFTIPSVAKLSDTQFNNQDTSNLLQKFEGEYIIQSKSAEFDKLESGTYYYEIVVDNAVVKRSNSFQLVNKIFGR